MRCCCCCCWRVGVVIFGSDKTIKEGDSENQPYLFNMFKNYMNALDKIRKTDFLKIVPNYRKYWNE